MSRQTSNSPISPAGKERTQIGLTLRSCRYRFASALCILLLIGVAASTQGQDPKISNNDLVPSREPEAELVLAAAMKAMGGADAWSKITSIRVIGTRDHDLASTATVEHINVLDDWSSGRPRFIQEVTNERAAYSLRSDGSKPLRLKRKDGTFSYLPIDEPENAFLSQVPAVTLSMMLLSRRLSLRSESNCKQNDICIRVSHLAHANYFDVDQVWSFNSVSSQLKSISYATRDARGGSNRPYTTIFFDHLRGQAGLMLPDEIRIVTANHNVTFIHIEQFILNPSFREEDFIMGVQ